VQGGGGLATHTMPGPARYENVECGGGGTETAGGCAVKRRWTASCTDQFTRLYALIHSLTGSGSPGPTSLRSPLGNAPLSAAFESSLS